ncbi:MAG: ribonuclease P protein component [bacterium]|nr:ribonuclease P protein component [bacterium]
MLNKQHRLRKEKDIQAVFSKGRGVRRGAVLIKFLQKGKGELRTGIVVSKKVFKSAVSRNRIRRVISEFLRVNLPSISKSGDALIIVLPGREARLYESVWLRESVQSALREFLIVITQ